MVGRKERGVARRGGTRASWEHAATAPQPRTCGRQLHPDRGRLLCDL